MKYVRNHIFLIFALVSILFSMEIYSLFNKIVKSYEQKILKNYTIIVVSKEKLNNLKLDNIANIEQINISKSLKNLDTQLKSFNLDVNKIKQTLPYFYKLHLKYFPTPASLDNLEKTLLKNPAIKRVESFRQNQNQIYNLLVIIKLVAAIFMFIILFISFLLIIKQLEVWRFEHSERMYIMELFGAPFWFRSAILIKLAFVDSLLSIGFIFIIIEWLQNSSMYENLLSQLGISVDINIFYDLSIFFLISLAISIFASVSVVLMKKDEVL